MRKIILLCASGMSTSMLVKKMQAAAKAENYEAEIAAYPTADAKKVASDADIVLLGPQVRFEAKKIAAEVPGVPVESIDMRLYGRMDGAGVLKLVRAKLGD